MIHFSSYIYFSLSIYSYSISQIMGIRCVRAVDATESFLDQNDDRKRLYQRYYIRNIDQWTRTIDWGDGCRALHPLLKSLLRYPSQDLRQIQPSRSKISALLGKYKILISKSTGSGRFPLPRAWLLSYRYFRPYVCNVGTRQNFLKIVVT